KFMKSSRFDFQDVPFCSRRRMLAGQEVAGSILLGLLCTSAVPLARNVTEAHEQRVQQANLEVRPAPILCLSANRSTGSLLRPTFCEPYGDSCLHRRGNPHCLGKGGCRIWSP